jgi:hypothetical protein
MTTRSVTAASDLERLIALLKSRAQPFTVSIADGASRSLNQNALLHKWYGEVAQQLGDVSAMAVKGRCHVAYGVPIRRRDPVWSRIWESLFAKLTYEQQCFLFERGVLAMTREMTVKELTEYMDAMSVDYRAQGVVLTEPTDER